MSDPLTCPDCNGAGANCLAPGLTVSCLFCRGQGMVGGEYGEPAEEPSHTEAISIPIWAEPGADEREAAFGCPQCLGMGVVMHADDIRGGKTTKVAESPCPACKG